MLTAIISQKSIEYVEDNLIWYEQNTAKLISAKKLKSRNYKIKKNKQIHVNLYYIIKKKIINIIPQWSYIFAATQTQQQKRQMHTIRS